MAHKGFLKKMKKCNKTKKQLIDELTKLRREMAKFKKDRKKKSISKKMPQDNTHKYLDILKELPEIVYKINPDGYFTFINNAVRVLGYEPEELIGKHFKKIVHPHDIKYFSRNFVLPKYKGKVIGDKNAPKLFDERRTGERRTKDLEIRLISKFWKKEKKDIREFIGIVTAFGDVSAIGHYHADIQSKDKQFLGSLGIIRDITERKQIEDALRKSEERYRDLVEKADIAIMIDDIEGKFKYYNERFAEFFGYSHKEMKNQSIETLVHPDDLKMVMGFHRDRIRGRKVPKSYEFRGMKKNGTMIYLEIHVVELKDGNKIIGTRSYLWDVTMRKHVEAQLRAQTLHDDLTGLHNRRGFTILGQQQQKLAKRNKKGFWILFADIDDLKWVNDNFGHKRGDKVLKNIAKILINSFRTSDIIARIGGDEFAVLTIEAHQRSGDFLVKRLLDNLKSFNAQSKYRFKLSMSIGTVYRDPKSPTTIDELLVQADTMMYRQKRRKQRT